MDQHHNAGAGPAACAILRALLDELVSSKTLTAEQVHSIYDAARATLERWGDYSAFKLGREVLDEMRPPR
jgi:hypothetical protein